MGSKLAKKDAHKYDLIAQSLSDEEGFLDKYLEAMEDPDLLHFRRQIGLLDARQAQLLAQVETGDSSEWRVDLRRTFGLLEDAILIDDPVMIKSSLAKHKELVTRGYNDAVAWKEIRSLATDSKLQRQAEAKRLKDNERMITYEQAMAIIGVVINVFSSHVKDKALMEAVSSDLASVLDRPTVIEG